MSTITVTNQAELHAALANRIEEITIRSERGVWLTIGDTRDSDVTIAGESTVKDCSGRVGRVTDSGSVGRVTGSGRVGRVTDSGSVGEVTGSGRVGEVTVSGSVGRVTGSGRVEWVTGSGRVGRVTGSGSVGEVTGSGRVGEVTDSGSVGRVTGSGRVEWVTDSGRVEHAAGTATVHLYGNAQLFKAAPHVAVFLHSAYATFSGGHLIDLTNLDLTNPRTWCEHHGISISDDEYALLYKAVRDDWKSAHGTSYQPGTTASCGDFTADGRCGGGLHVSPTPSQAKAYDSEATRFIEVRVDLAVMNVIDADKVKAESVECVREVDAHGRPITNPLGTKDGATS